VAGPCSADFRRVADQLGGIDCASADPVVAFRNPFGLEHWTMPIVEVLMVVGAVLTLVHAVRRRRDGDAAPLVLWIAMVVYVSVIEPPLYFPEEFGIDEAVGLIFVHNTFSVQFLFDRLPLYIVALYPAVIYVTYLLVDRLGVFRRRGPVVGAVSVAFLYQCFYEIFDHIGPQLRWWAWNAEVKTSEPALGSVPLSSTVIFAGLAPFVVTLLVRLLAARNAPDRPSVGWIAWRCVAIGLLTPLLLPIVSMPINLAGLGDEPNHTIQAVLYGAQMVLFAVVALPALARAARGRGPGRAPSAGPSLEVILGAAYLVAFAFLWVTALPELLGAHDGRTADGDPVGNVPYVLACFAVCAWVLVLSARTGPAVADDRRDRTTVAR
jgi:hypothetical protein